MALNASFGVLEELLDEPERDGKYFVEKEQKVAFLDKVIALVNEVLGVKLPVRSGKITAGAEVEKTNEFLQALAKVVTTTTKAEWSQASARVPSLRSGNSNATIKQQQQQQPLPQPPPPPPTVTTTTWATVAPSSAVPTVAETAPAAGAGGSRSSSSSFRGLGSEDISVTDLTSLQAELTEFMKQATPWVTHPSYALPTTTNLVSEIGIGIGGESLGDSNGSGGGEADAFFTKIDQDLYALEKQLKGLAKTPSASASVDRISTSNSSVAVVPLEGGGELSEEAILQAMEQVRREAEEISTLMSLGDKLVSKLTKLVTSSATVITPSVSTE